MQDRCKRYKDIPAWHYLKKKLAGKAADAGRTKTGGHSGEGIYTDLLSIFIFSFKLDPAVDFGIKGVIDSQTDILAGMKPGAPLSQNNGTGVDHLTAVRFYA
jgi:hypothetical protein